MNPRLEVVPGAGVVFRFGNIAAWAGPEASSALLGFLAQSARNLGPSARGGDLFADHLEGVLEGSDPEPEAPFVIVGPDGRGGLAAVLHGPAQLWDGRRWLAPGPGETWARTSVATIPLLVAGAAGLAPAPGGGAAVLDLEAGAVPGAGFALVDSAVPSEPPGVEEAPAQVAGPASTEAFTGELPGGPAIAGTVGIPAGRGLVAPGAGAGAVPLGPASVRAGDRADETTVLPGRDRDRRGADETTVLPGRDRDRRGADETTVLSAGAGVRPGDATTALPLAGAEPTTTLAAVPGSRAEARRPPGVTGLWPVAGGPPPAEPPGAVAALPVVRGVRCRHGHFNHPDSQVCVRCHEGIAGKRRAVSGPRPPVGVLVADDGAVYALDGDYVVGSRPETGGTDRPLRLEGDRVAATHAEIRLGEWSLTLIDRSGQPATHVMAPGDDAWRAVPAHNPTVLRPGTHVAVGSRVLTFVSPWPG